MCMCKDFRKKMSDCLTVVSGKDAMVPPFGLPASVALKSTLSCNKCRKL